MRRPMILPAVLVTFAVAGCTAGGPTTSPTTTTPQSATSESEPESATPSITRQVPPQQRQSLADASAQQLCGLVTVDELEKLAYPVRPGAPREIGLEPPVRGCQFEAQTGVRSLLLGSQPGGYADLGEEDVVLGSARGTQTLHTDGCTVFAPVAGSTLQVTANAPEADSDECDTAQGVAQYVLSGIR